MCPIMFGAPWFGLLLLGSCLISKNVALKCYTCGGYEDNLPCTEFQIENTKFIRECESGSKSCRLTRKVNENLILSRSCESLQLDDCKTANSIEFCYCTGDLCNKINPSDDESGDEEFNDDLLEGSGTPRNDVDTTSEPNIILSTGKGHDKIEENVIVIKSGCSQLYWSIWCFSTFLIYFCIVL